MSTIKYYFYFIFMAKKIIQPFKKLTVYVNSTKFLLFTKKILKALEK